jgi:hypothetical protein
MEIGARLDKRPTTDMKTVTPVRKHKRTEPSFSMVRQLPPCTNVRELNAREMEVAGSWRAR